MGPREKRTAAVSYQNRTRESSRLAADRARNTSGESSCTGSLECWMVARPTLRPTQASPTDPKFQFRTWLKANPSLEHLPSLLAEIRSEAADAKKDPAMLAAFESLRLNLGTSDTVERVLLAAGTWERIEGKGVRLGEYVLGVDLGGAAAMCGCCRILACIRAVA